MRRQVLDISQTNLANFGSELEYKIKQESAEGEPEFKQFIAGGTLGTYVWRVHNFKLVRTLYELSQPAASNIGIDFFRGDCYLVLSATGSIEHPVYTIFYWIGDSTSIDEAGTVAYKAFELDNVLTRGQSHATQYREVCGNETPLFRAVIPNMRLLDGGFDSGFHHVTVPKRTPRLLQVFTDHTVEVPLMWSSLRTNGVFILDNGIVLYQWTGSKSSTRLRAPAMAVVRALDDTRGINTTIVVINEYDMDSSATAFAELLGRTDATNRRGADVQSGTRRADAEFSAQGYDYTGPDDTENVETHIDKNIVAKINTRVILWTGLNFKELIPHVNETGMGANDFEYVMTAGEIYIEDTGKLCTVHTPADKMLLASLCIMAYFTWSRTRPVTTKIMVQ